MVRRPNPSMRWTVHLRLPELNIWSVFHMSAWFERFFCPQIFLSAKIALCCHPCLKRCDSWLYSRLVIKRVQVMGFNDVNICRCYHNDFHHHKVTNIMLSLISLKSQIFGYKINYRIMDHIIWPILYGLYNIERLKKYDTIKNLKCVNGLEKW